MKHRIGLIIDNQSYEGEYTIFSDGAGSLNLPVVTPQRFLSLTIPTTLPVDSVYSVLLQFERLCFGILNGSFEMILNVPYYPYGRADRVFEDGMVNPRKLFTKFAHRIGFTEVITDDIHSYEVGVKSIYDYDYMKRLLFSLPNDLLLVAPDAGAEERVKNVAERFNLQYIVCDKQRNVTNGWITGYDVPDDIDMNNRDCLIIDDICDGGKTFEICANSLKDRGVKSVSLFVTHGIFSKGLDLFNGVLDTIHCKHIVRDYISEQDLKSFNGGK